MADKRVCGDCRFHLKRGVCPKAEYKKHADNLLACSSTDSACELFQAKFNPDQFNAKALGDLIKKKHRFFSQNERDHIWVYNPNMGIWEPTGTELIQAEALKLLGDEFKRDRIQEAIKYVQYSSYFVPEKLGGPANKTVMTNGVFNLLTEEFENFDPELYATTAIPIEYDKNADCPAIKKFLSEIVNEKDVQKLIELAGYCLYKGYPIARLVIMVGEGSNGKSTYLELLKTLLGPENVSGLTLQQLSENTGFSEAELFGKLANICGDIPATALKDTGTIKKATGRDLIHANRKFRSFLTFVNYAKLIFSANKLPSSRDESLAYHRRATIIDFPNRFDEGDPSTDPNIIKKLTTDDELSGFFNLAVTGLQNFLSRGKFSGEASTEQKRLDYVKRSDPIQYFCMEFIEEDLSNEIEKTTLYDYYVRLCHKLGHKPTSSNWFSQSFRRYITYAEDISFRNSDNKKVRAWRGIRIDLERLNKEFGTIGTIGTIFSKCAQQSILHKGEKKREISSQSSQSFQNPEIEHEKRKKGNDIIQGLFPEDQFPVCFSCHEPISQLSQLTNIEGKPIHISCKARIDAQKKKPLEVPVV